MKLTHKFEEYRKYIDYDLTISVSFDMFTLHTAYFKDNNISKFIYNVRSYYKLKEMLK